MISVVKKEIKVSVRNLVEFILRSGDLDNRRGGSADKDAMAEGSRIHRKIQKMMGSTYKAEVAMKLTIPVDEFWLTVEGRADGVIEKDGFITIDEIKGVYQKLEHITEPNIIHLAQARCYAHMYCISHDITSIKVQMTYCNIESEEIKRFEESFDSKDLSIWFHDIVSQYMKWAQFVMDARNTRNASIKEVQFPFPYRKGQKDVAVNVYKAISLKKNLFVQAPTGVGKTISTLFPAVKAIGEELGEKIFYLTAKTITRTAASDGMDLLRQQGLKMSSIMLTAKDKMCVCDEVDCNPDACPRAKGHFDRVNDAVYNLITSKQIMNRENLLVQAEEYNICPFELGLDVSSFMDVIICDYNYVFDPNVQLKRFFADGVANKDYIFLVDEAHNLVDRAREMYSAVLYKESFLEMKKYLAGYSKRCSNLADKCNSNLLVLKNECESFQVVAGLGNFTLNLIRLQSELDTFLQENRELPDRKKLVEFYLNIRNFLNMEDRIDDGYEIYTEIESDGRFKVKLFCIEPANQLKQCLEKGNSAIFFSATLLPVLYYKEMLSGYKDDYAIYISSPFDQEKRMLAVCNDVSSKYTRRGYDEYIKIIDYIDKVIDQRPGNYMVFFPSYSMLNEVYQIAQDRGLYIKTRLMAQESNMTERDREKFLEEFSVVSPKSLIGFCVMGGIFSEGIDLKNDQLIGTLIFGTGLPQVCTEREILKDHFNEMNKNGFDYAYLYPGMNKVLQSAGRVIRTQEDTGIILLMDERFHQRQYQGLFPREWQDYKSITRSDISHLLNQFWNRQETGE